MIARMGLLRYSNLQKSSKKDTDLQHQQSFKVQVNIKDFIGSQKMNSKNLGFFDDVQTLLYKENKNVFYVKTINKKNIIDKNYQRILNINYNVFNSDRNILKYILNLETQFEDNENLFLVFEGIQKYTSLEIYLKEHSSNITEENLIVIFRQILESAKFLHNNNIYGCQLYLSSYIYDISTGTIKLTDTGFSKIFDSSKNIYDNELKNGFKFNEYTPPEVFTKLGDSVSKSEIEKIQNSFFDIWQLGILFFKIAVNGESPYDNAKNGNLKECILNKNINYTKLDKYNSKIAQIIDKMLQKVPEKRYDINKLLSLLKQSQNIDENPLLNNQVPNKKESVITMNMVQKEENNQKMEKDIIINEEVNKNDESTDNNNKDLLNGIKIQGNFVNDNKILINQEIYPDGSVLPIFKNKYLNRFQSNVDQSLISDLAYKLNLLEKEYQKLGENKLAVYNITNYINNYLKELNAIDNDNINYLIKKFNNLMLSKIETNDLYEEMLKDKEEFTQDKFKALISNLLYEIKKLGIELDQEKSTNEKLRKKIKEQEKKNLDLKNEHQERVEFYQKKIEVLEEVIFSIENKNINNNDLKNKNKLIYNALTSSIENFTELNKTLKKSIEENILKFKDNKKNWLEDVIKAKEDFRKEMSFYLNKSVNEPKIYNFYKTEKPEIKNKTKENVELLKKEIEELKKLNNEMNNCIIKDKNYRMNIEKELKEKDKMIEILKGELNNKEDS